MEISRVWKKINWMSLFNLLMIAYLLINTHCLYKSLLSNIRMAKTSHIGYGFTEFLINWQGGYVRRGLVGELFYQLCKAVAFNPLPVIIVISIIAYLAFVVIFFLMLKKADLVWWIMFLPFSLGGMPVVRKDHICFLLVLLILSLLRSTFKYRWLKLVCIYLAVGLLLQVHEAFFFVVAPLVMVYLYAREFSDWSNQFVRIGLSTIPLLAPFLLLCHYHGTDEVAHAIYNSWIKVCPALSDYQFTQDDSIGAIGWKTVSTIKFHLKQSVLIYDPLTLIFTYYVTSRWLVVFNGDRSDVAQDQAILNAILQFQFLMLFPLFTVLSCDFGRISMYWIVSTICFYCQLKTEIGQILSEHETIFKVSKQVDSLFDYVFKPTRFLVCVLILLITVPNAGNPWIPTSVRNGFADYTKTILQRVVK